MTKPIVYADSDIFISVIKKDAGRWPTDLKVLMAGERGDIQLVASTLVLAEVGAWRGDVDAQGQSAIIRQFLDQPHIGWHEVDRRSGPRVRAAVGQPGLTDR